MGGIYHLPNVLSRGNCGGIANHINADDKYSPDVVKMPGFHLQGLNFIIFCVIAWRSLRKIELPSD